MTAGLLPTPTDWHLARAAVLDPDLLDRLGETPDLDAKPVADLVPGDGFVSRGQVSVCSGFPTTYPVPGNPVGVVTVPREGELTEAEHVDGTILVTWRARAVNYGTVRCPQCWVNVGRDHTPQECRDLQQERAYKRAGDW